MIIDVPRSYVGFGDRWFPAYGLVCPPDVKRPRETEIQRSLGGRGGPGLANVPISDCVYVAGENGILVEVEQSEERLGYEVILRCLTCSPTPSDGDVIWLPETVAIYGRTLVPQPRPRNAGVSRWRGADGEWVAEFIDRVTKLPFEVPLGPRAKLVPLSTIYPEVAHVLAGSPADHLR
jgi:hypothetical protein